METQFVRNQEGLKLALTRVEAARALGLSTVTLDRITERGLLRPSRATRRPLFPIWELERFLRESSLVITLAKGGAK